MIVVVWFFVWFFVIKFGTVCDVVKIVGVFGDEEENKSERVGGGKDGRTEEEGRRS